MPLLFARARTRALRLVSLFVVAAMSLSACTAVTGATDYKVDAEREKEERDKMLLMTTRSLDYTFTSFEAHERTALDVAVVDDAQMVQARARIILRPAVSLPYPDEELKLDKVLSPGPFQLYFYVDTNGNDEIDGTKQEPVEHIWIKPVNADGTGSFVHKTMFQFFSEQDYVMLEHLELELPAGPALPTIMKTDSMAVRAAKAKYITGVHSCLANRIGKKFKDTLEIKLTFADDGREVGYFKIYHGAPPPLDGHIELKGIVDSGSRYEFDVFVDGQLKKTFMDNAPQSGPWMIPFADWAPAQIADLDFDVKGCAGLPMLP
jgi:hypothetical protein